MSSARVLRLIAVGFVVIFGTEALAPLVQGQLSLPGCDVAPGQSIQTAVNAAQPGQRIIVCAGVYSESVTISTNRIAIEGQLGTVLDGSLLSGTRNGFVLSPGLDSFALTGFEIRNFKNPLVSTGDTSSGILAPGTATHIAVLNTSIHDNAWAGILLTGTLSRWWNITNDSFQANGFVGIYLANATNSVIANNTFTSSYQGIIIAGAWDVKIQNNTFTGPTTGTSRVAIAVTPSLLGDMQSNAVLVQRNVISGRWAQSIWLTGAYSTIVRDNQLGGAQLSAGGSALDIQLHNNTGARVFQTQRVQDATDSFRVGNLAHGHGTYRNADRNDTENNNDGNNGNNNGNGGQANVAPSSLIPRCTGLDCLTHLIGRIIDAIMPTASAQAPDLACAQSASCNTTLVNAVLTYVLQTVLPPLTGPTDAHDYANLNGCVARSDSCLEQAFFANDSTPLTSWTMNVPTQVLGSPAQLRFIDVGTRKPSESLARHNRVDDLNQSWTTLVLCRLVVSNVTGPCDIAPALFDYGLDINWTQSALPQEVSRWRMLLPTDVTHDTFERLHGPDATLFRLTTKPRDASTPPPPDAITPPATTAVDAARVQMAGRAVLVCQIAVTVANAGPFQRGQNDCPTTALLHDAIQPLLYWCNGTLPLQPDVIHNTMLAEATVAWPWSSTCMPTSGANTGNWTDLLSGQDYLDLGTAQQAYYNASTDAARASANQNGTNVFTRLIARHLSLGIPGQGMPNQTNSQLLRTVLPTTLSARLPIASSSPHAIAAGNFAYIFGGSASVCNPISLNNHCNGYDLNAYRFDPSTQTVTTFATLPTSVTQESSASDIDHWGGALATDGTTAWLFRDISAAGSNELVTLQQVNLATNNVILVELIAPVPIERGQAVYYAGCSCVYIFTQFGSVLRFDPLTTTFQTLSATLPFAPKTAAWTGGYAFLTGSNSNQIARFDATSQTVQIMAPSLPSQPCAATSTTDGMFVYILGGGGCPATPNGNTILQYDIARDRLSTLPTPLPQPLREAASAWVNSKGYVFGGFSSTSGALATIVQFAQITDITGASAIISSASNNYNVISLVNETGASNIGFNSSQAADEFATWFQINKTGLVPPTLIQVGAAINFTTLAGDTLRYNVTTTLTDQGLSFPSPVLVTYANNTLADTIATDPDNLNYASGYLNASDHRTHTLALLNATSGSASVGQGLIDTTLTLPIDATQFTVCARQAWTAQADASQDNLIPATRLALDQKLSCLTQTNLSPILLHDMAPLSVSIEFRNGWNYSANLSLTHDPTHHTANATNEMTGTPLALAGSAYQPTLWDQSVEPVAARIIAQVPTNLTPLQKASELANVISNLMTSVNIIAVEVDDLPMTGDLADAISTAVAAYGTTILVGAGVLPQAARGLAPQDKLMTISGLAADPHVITVGAASATGGVASWSRRGPTPLLLPKPDLTAPSPTGTTGLAVANVLPYAEALASRGFRDPTLVRSILATFAIDTTNELGAPATYWEQGLGVIDLNSYLILPDTATLLSNAATPWGAGINTSTAYVSQMFNTTSTSITNAAPEAIVGLAALPSSLVRGAVAATLVNTSLSPIALPGTAAVDFGIVNHNISGSADFSPIVIQPVAMSLANSTSLLLQNAGYTQTAADQRQQDLATLYQNQFSNGTDVTLNVTHYYTTDLLNQGDFLYSTYSGLLSQEQLNRAIDITPGQLANLSMLQGNLSQWVLRTPHYFAPEVHTHLNSTNLPGPAEAPSIGLMNLTAAILNLLQQEDRLHAGTIKQSAADTILTQVQTDSARLLNLPEIKQQNFQGLSNIPIATQRQVLTALQNSTTAMRALKAQPSGAWTQTEAAAGAWNGTVLGGEINATAAALGFNAITLAQNSTLLLDAITECINRALGLLDRELTPTKSAQNLLAKTILTGTGTFATDPARTSADDAKMGPYVGLATMTTHNVRTYDPFSNATTARRDITIPVPSFLWNNPTLNWHHYFRGDIPLPGAGITLKAYTSQVFNRTNVTYTTNVTQNGVNVYTGVDRDALYAPELQGAQAAQANIVSEINNQTQLAVAGKSAGTLKGMLQQYNDSLTNWIATLQNASATNCVPCPANSLATYTALDSAMALYTSHLQDEANTTNSTGVTNLSYLFPGTYILYSPYDFVQDVALDQDYPYAVPGYGILGENLSDTNYATARFARDRADQLPTHPSGTPRPNGVDDGFYEQVWTEIDGTARGPFHQFGLNITGADLPGGIACMDTRRFQQITGASFAVPGCGEVPIDPQVLANLTKLRSYARCMIGAPHSQIDAPSETRCTEAATNISAARNQCALTGDCAAITADVAIINESVGLANQLTNLIGQKQMPTYPWLRSPGRVLRQNPASFGFTRDALLPTTRIINGLASTDSSQDQTFIPAIDSLLTATNLSQLVNSSINNGIGIDAPPKDAVFNNTVPEGIMHHLTDKVAGQDWSQFGIQVTSPPATDGLAVQTLINFESKMFVNPNDITGLANFIRDLVDSDIVPDPSVLGTHFNIGLQTAIGHWTGTNGWLPNGTTAGGGLWLNDTDTTQSITGPCQTAGSSLSIPPSYFPKCGDIGALVTPGVAAYGGVDKVQFADALRDQTIGYPKSEDAINRTDAINATIRNRVNNTLEASARLSGAIQGRTVRRAADGIAMNTSARDLPAAGVMMYSMPLPSQEAMNYRLDAEFYLQNTAALMITVVNPSIADSIYQALGSANFLNQAQSDPLGTVTRITQIVGGIDQTVQGKGQLRVDLFGLPLAVGGGSPDVLSPDDPKSGIHATNGVVAVRTDGYYNISRRYSLHTKGLDPGHMDFFIIYFPSAGLTRGPGVAQEFMMKNFTVSASTYLGPSLDTYSLDFLDRTGYRNNTEDWNAWYAIPGLKVNTSQNMTPALGPGYGEANIGVTTNITAGTHNFQANRSYLAPPYGINISTASAPTYFTTRSTNTTCSDGAAGGYANTSTILPPRGTPKGYGGQSFDLQTDCQGEAMQGTQPVKQTRSPRSAYVTEPDKHVIDALQYNFGIIPTEHFETAVSPRDTSIPSTNPYSDPSTMSQSSGATGTSSAFAPESSQGSTSTFLTGYVLNTLGGLGYGQGTPIAAVLAATGLEEFLQAPPPIRGGPAATGSPSDLGHNFVVLDISVARADLRNASGVLYRDQTYTGEKAKLLAQDRERNATVVPHGQHLTARVDTPFSALVLAYAENQTVSAMDGTITHVAAFAANGMTGAGIDLQIDVTNTTGNPPAPTLTSLTTVRAYNLGGRYTPGADCWKLPLYAIVEPYYRCTGYTQATNYPLVISSQITGFAYVQSLLATVPPTPTAASGIFAGTALAQSAVTQLEDAKPDFVTPSAANISVQAQSKANETSNVTIAAVALGAWMEQHVAPQYQAFLLGTLAGLQTNVTNALQNSTLNGTAANYSSSIQNITQLTHPDLVQCQDPPRFQCGEINLVSVLLNISQGVRSLGYWNASTSLTVNYSVQEWTSNLTNGKINVTLAVPNQQPVQWTAANLTGPIGNHPQFGNIVFSVSEGARYELNATVHDDAGNALTDKVVFIRDSTPPSVACAPIALSYTNSNQITYSRQDTASLSCNITDTLSGVANATLYLKVGAAAAVPIANVSSGGNGYLNASPWLRDLPDGVGVTISVNRTDNAGNTANNTVATLVRDTTPPDLVRLLTSATNTTNLSATASAYDNISGLANWTFGIWNETSQAWSAVNQSALSGPTAGTPLTGPTWLDIYYDVNLSATDNVGNTKSLPIFRAKITSTAIFRPISPRVNYQQSDYLIHFLANVSIDNFPGYVPDVVYVNATPIGPKGVPPVFHQVVYPTTHLVDVWWYDAVNETPGPFQIRMTGTRNGLPDLMDSHVNITADSQPIQLSEGTAVGTLNGTADYDRYQLAYPAGCASGFTIQLEDADANATSGRNITFWIGDATASGIDTTTYNNGTRSTATSSFTTKASVTPPSGGTYYVLVKHTGATNSTYQLRYTNLCLGFDDSTRLPPEGAVSIPPSN